MDTTRAMKCDSKYKKKQLGWKTTSKKQQQREQKSKVDNYQKNKTTKQNKTKILLNIHAMQIMCLSNL